jgi:hypothetical protein
MDKLATGRKRKPRVRGKTLSTVTIGEREAKQLLDRACKVIWPPRADQEFDGNIWKWRAAWYVKLEEVFYPYFADIILCEGKIDPADYQKLQLLAGEHGRTIYLALKARMK